jgi:hypothetical protein
MRPQLEQRLATLQSEHDAGQKMLADLDTRRAALTQTLLRIEGAMQVLRELLANTADQEGGAEPPAPAQ